MWLGLKRYAARTANGSEVSSAYGGDGCGEIWGGNAELCRNCHAAVEGLEGTAAIAVLLSAGSLAGCVAQPQSHPSQSSQ